MPKARSPCRRARSLVHGRFSTGFWKSRGHLFDAHKSKVYPCFDGFGRKHAVSDESTRSDELEETRDGHVITKGSPLAPRAYHGAHGPRGDSRGAQQGLHAAKEATRNELRLGENGWF